MESYQISIPLTTMHSTIKGKSLSNLFLQQSYVSDSSSGKSSMDFFIQYIT